MFNTELEDIKNKQGELNNTITEMKNTLEGISSRKTEAEEQIRELEYRMVEITAMEQNKEKRMKRMEDSLRDLWDIMHNIQIIDIPEEEAKNKGSEEIFEEIIAETSPAWERKWSVKSRKHRESHTGEIQGETHRDTY